jgi:hypothetical protein
MPKVTRIATPVIPATALQNRRGEEPLLSVENVWVQLHPHGHRIGPRSFAHGGWAASLYFLSKKEY